jgi:cell division protease FtsH
MRKQRSEWARGLANGVGSFVSHRLNEVQDILGQWMLSEGKEEVVPQPEIEASECCRWSFHQLGHVTVALATGDVESVEKMDGAIRTSGCSTCNPLNLRRERWIQERSGLEKRMSILMGGRAAEALFFDDVSTLSSEDLREATEIARAMVMRFGMSSSLGLVSFVTPADRVFPGHSDATARMIDHEVQNHLDRAFSKACERLEFARPFLEKSVERLQRKGSVYSEQIRRGWHEFEGKTLGESHEAPVAPHVAAPDATGTENVLMH